MPDVTSDTFPLAHTAAVKYSRNARMVTETHVQIIDTLGLFP